MNGTRTVNGSQSAGRRLIEDTCLRFWETCGWPLRFEELLSSDEPPSDDAEQLWRRPLTDGQNCIGELVLDLPDDERLDIEFLQMTKAAEMIAALLEEALSARTAAEVSRQENEELARIGSTPPEQTDLASALDQLLAAVSQLTGFRAIAFFLLDPAGQTLRLRHQHNRVPVDVPFPERPLHFGCPDSRALHGETIIYRRWLHPESLEWLPAGMATATCFPVRSHEGPIGTLWMFDRRDRQVEPREFHVLNSITMQLGNLLERAVLLSESASEKQLRKHLKAAGESAPGRSLTEPGPGCGFESAGVYRSSLEIGGDLVDLIPLSSTRTLIAVGDASGHGIPAAMVMANVRGAVHTVAQGLADGTLTTDTAVAAINRTLCRVTPTHQFMSIVLGVYDTELRKFEYTNAGHPTPFQFRNGQVSELESHGLLLGVLEQADYERSAIDVAAGDLLVFYTDGVSEAMSRSNSMFRSEGIVGAVLSQPEGTAQEIVEEVWSRLTAHELGGSDEVDDRSLLVLRVR